MKKLLSILLILSLLAANLVIPAGAVAMDAPGILIQGSIGAGKWSISDSGVLRIRAEGRYSELLPDWDTYPWHQYSTIIGAVVVDENIYNISDNAFANLPNLTYVEFGKNVGYIGDDPFQGSDNLNTIVFQGDPPRVHYKPFNGVKATLYYPADNSMWSQERMDNYRNCYIDEPCELTFVPYTEKPAMPETFPDFGPPVRIDGDYSLGVAWDFWSDSRLVIRTTGSGNKRMENYPEYDDAYPEWYHHRLNIKALEVQEGILSIGERAFAGYSNLETVQLPEGLDEIGVEAFSDCTSLKQITIPDGTTFISTGAFFNCVSLSDVQLGQGVEYIYSQAFYGCSNLSEIILPDSLHLINEMTFACCTGLSEITIPAGVTEVDRMAFASCTNLNSVTFTGDAPEFGEDVFYEDALVCYYPADNPTWTEDVRQDYGGSVTWLPAGAELTSLELVSAPANTTYALGDTVDLTGIQAMATYSNGTQRELDAQSLTLEEADLSATGVQDVVVSHQGMTISFPVYVHAGRTEVILEPSGYPESAHNYGNSLEDVQSISCPGAASLTLVFSESTAVEQDYDHIYVSDKDYVTYGYYTGTEAAGITVTVPGDTAYIMLESDSSNSDYGYSFDSITASVVAHDYTGGVCSICGQNSSGEAEPGDAIRGDLNEDGAVTSDDAVHLLYHTLFGFIFYPIDQDCDFNQDSSVDSDDALYLLYHSLFGEALYPLN